MEFKVDLSTFEISNLTEDDMADAFHDGHWRIPGKVMVRVDSHAINLYHPDTILTGAVDIQVEFENGIRLIDSAGKYVDLNNLSRLWPSGFKSLVLVMVALDTRVCDLKLLRWISDNAKICPRKGPLCLV